LTELEKKNNDLKKVITDYKSNQLDNWDKKKNEFRKDLDELGNSIAGFFNND